MPKAKSVATAPKRKPLPAIPQQKKVAKPLPRTPRPKAKSPTTQKSSSVGRAAGTTIGSTLASLIPIPGASLIGGALGGWLGDKAGTFLGLGEYHVGHIQQNSLVNEGQSPPNMHTEVTDSIVTHRESLGFITASSTLGAFKVQNVPIQPGLASSFPWLANIAQCYREYVPLGIVFEFKSSTSAWGGSSSPATGMVAMGTDYDAYNTTPFANWIQIENSEHSTSSQPNQSFFHAVECKPRENVLERMYVRTGAIATQRPPEFFDLGTFAIASQGCPVATQVLGELWASVQFKFSKATIVPAQTTAFQVDAFTCANGLAATPFLNAVPNTSNTIGGFITPGSANVYNFPPQIQAGDYLVNVIANGTAAAVNNFLGTYTNCATVASGLTAGTASVQSVPGTVTTAFFMQRVRVTQSGASFGITNTGLLPTASVVYLVVTQCDATLI